MKVEMLPLGNINPAPYNPRVDLDPEDDEYIRIRNSIKEFGCVEPLVINKNSTLIGGHQRLKVMKEIGFTEAPVIRVDLDEQKEKALNLALNRITGVWDIPLLSNLIKEIYNLPDVDIKLAGFPSSNLDSLLHDVDVSFYFINDPLDGYTPQVRKPIICPFCGEEVDQ